MLKILSHTRTHTRSQASFPYNCYINTLNRLHLYLTVCSVVYFIIFRNGTLKFAVISHRLFVISVAANVLAC